jgi:hypothetical protein
VTASNAAFLDALSEYVGVLEKGAATTTRAEDRPRYRDHLAQAARIFSAVTISEPDWTKVRDIVQDEERAFGWSYLSDDVGAAAEAGLSRLRAHMPRE